MMRIEKTQNYRPVLHECFKSDEELLKQWHIFAGKGLSACVERTFRDLQIASVQFFKVVVADELVGYFAKEACGDKEYLSGFFLMPDMRTDEVKKTFWNLVRSQFDQPFFCGLWEKNIPACKFIESRGGRNVQRIRLADGEAVLYKIGV